MQWQSSWCCWHIFFSASLGDAFMNHARLNNLIQFQQPMSDPTNEPSREPIRKPTNNRMEINKVKSNKREPIASHSSIKQDKSTPTFHLIVASVSNKKKPIASHLSIKYLRTSQVPPVWVELVRASSKLMYIPKDKLTLGNHFLSLLRK
jgi:hypothetical protein